MLFMFMIFLRVLGDHVKRLKYIMKNFFWPKKKGSAENL